MGENALKCQLGKTIAYLSNRKVSGTNGMNSGGQESEPMSPAHDPLLLHLVLPLNVPLKLFSEENYMYISSILQDFMVVLSLLYAHVISHSRSSLSSTEMILFLNANVTSHPNT